MTKEHPPRPCSFGPAFRLHYRKDYRRFFENSQIFRLSQCLVFRIKNEFGHYRLGITLKARGTSIERNRVKRTIRETFRRLAPCLGAFDYNVVVPSGRKMGYPYPIRLRETLGVELKNALGKK